MQAAQYTNCIFWSDNPYISDISKRTNYTLTHTSQLPLCYSSIPDNTFKAFYLAFGVNSDPNWGNKAYRDSFAKATWATQVFSYYGARTIGIVGHDDPDFNIVLPKDCRGLMFDARNIENAGTFDAVNTTNFGAKSGSWREAFGFCISLRRLYIKNLKVSLNISWSPIDYDSISYIISAAANTSAIKISVSPYTYNLLSQSDFDLATSKNITIELLTSNYVEDKRLSSIANKADKEHTHTIEDVENLQTTLDGYATKTYADNAANTVKNDLLNGAGEAYDTLKELGDLINENVDAIEALETVATNKADKEHTHNIEDITGLESVGTQSDWNVNDESDPAYVKNRPFYTTGSTTSIYSETNDTFYEVSWDGPVTYYTTTFIAEAPLLEVGKKYTVVWDGTTYSNLECYLFEDTPVVGDPGFVQCPFVINYFVGELRTSMSGESHTFEILLSDEEYVKIDEKYLPTMIGKPGTGVNSEIFNSYTSNEASGNCSHAEGVSTTASGDYSHAEGFGTVASGSNSHTEGTDTTASGMNSHAEGYGTTAAGIYQHVQGKNNIADTEDRYAHIVGNGGAKSRRSNAHTLDWSGNAEFQGDVKANACGGENPISLVELYNTIQTLTERIAVLEAALNTDSLTETDANALVEEVFN